MTPNFQGLSSHAAHGQDRLTLEPGNWEHSVVWHESPLADLLPHLKMGVVLLTSGIVMTMR